MAAESKAIKYISWTAAGIVVLALSVTIILQNRRINFLTGESSRNYPREEIEKYKAENYRLKSQIADMQAWQDYLEDTLNEKSTDSGISTQTRPVENMMADNAPGIRNNPALRNGLRSSISSGYDALAEVIGLSEETKSKLIDLLAEMRAEIMGRLPGRGGFQGAMADREALVQQLEEINSIYNGKLSELLTEDELYAFREYQNSQQERMLITAFSSIMSEDVAPIDKEQEKELADALYSARQANPDTKREDELSLLGGPFGPARMNSDPETREKLNSVYIESARDILSDDQMQKFEEFIAADQSGFFMRRGPGPGRFQ